MATNKRQRQKQAQQARRAYIQAQQRRAQKRRKALAGVALLLIMGLVVGAFASTGGRDEEPDAAPKGPDCSPVAGKSTFPAPPPDTIDRAKSYRATVQTDVGTFTVDLDDEKAPKTVNNFVFLARSQFYDCVPFHRVIPGFVVQGGDGEKGTGTGGPGYTITDELPAAGPYPEGALAMANTGEPNSGGSQFFIITGPQGMALPPQYSLFGMVSEGFDVVKKIEADGTTQGTPKVVHKMLKVTIAES
ncbi:MAG TPA: peptidylprolyl isomerase [Acidimicrobiales bacterium]|nr:peptidylprolyl isomerase [Acidimicrobiales bacterium]